MSCRAKRHGDDRFRQIHPGAGDEVSAGADS